MKWYNWILCLVNKARREALHKVVEEQRKKDHAAKVKEAEEYCQTLRTYGKSATNAGVEIRLSDSLWGGRICYPSLKEAKKEHSEWLAEVAHARAEEWKRSHESLVEAYNAGKMDVVESRLRRFSANGTIVGQNMYWANGQFPDPAVACHEIPPKAVPYKAKIGRKKK